MKYIILQNTMAPYRISLFNKMHEMGLDIEVLYMCKLESGRSWVIDESSIKYPYHVADGYKGMFLGHAFYWCPEFLKRFIKEKDIKIILGGAWVFNTVIITCILERLGLVKAEILFWTEANFMSNGARKKNKLRDWLRKFVYTTGAGRIIVPGKMAILSFDKWGIKNRKFIKLPNVIEEEVFGQVESNHIFSSLSEQPVFALPVRLTERIKGVINFFTAIGKDNIISSQFIVMGDGEDMEQTRNFINSHGYQNNIHLMGFCSMDVVRDIYKKSDILLLPSFSDQSPLALVEGCCVGMPILASNRCGNHYETIEEAVNGFTFNPDNHAEVKKKFEDIIACRNQWPEMGQKSRSLYETNFKQDKVVRNFVSQMKSLYE